MKSALNDLRILKLAEMYENAYERFVFEVAERIVKDDDVRASLMRLVTPTDAHHGRIIEHMTRLNEQLTPADLAAVELAALEDVVEVEQAAREFYLQHADQLHDVSTVKLFRELAHEEEQHVKLAREALRVAEEKAAKRGITRGSTSSFRQASILNRAKEPAG